MGKSVSCQILRFSKSPQKLCSENRATVKNFTFRKQYSESSFPVMTHANNILYGFEQFLMRS